MRLFSTNIASQPVFRMDRLNESIVLLRSKKTTEKAILNIIHFNPSNCLVSLLKFNIWTDRNPTINISNWQIMVTDWNTDRWACRYSDIHLWPCCTGHFWFPKGLQRHLKAAFCTSFTITLVFCVYTQKHRKIFRIRNVCSINRVLGVIHVHSRRSHVNCNGSTVLLSS